MVDVKEYLKEASGQWLRADNCQVGDKLEVLGAGEIDSETFDRSYLNIPVKVLRTGEKYTFRMGTRNASRVVDVLGKNTEKWVGKQIEVFSIEHYKGLGQKGIIVRGVASPSATPSKAGELSVATIDVIHKSQDILEMGVGLTESDWSVLQAGVRAELLKHKLAEKKGEFYFFSEKAKEYM